MTENRSVPPSQHAAHKDLSLYQDKYLGFSFFYPAAWHRFDWTDRRRGVLFGPQPADNATLFAVAIQELGTTITTKDLNDLKMGFLTGIARLSQSAIETQDQWKAGPVHCLEARYTFAEGDAVRKRWVRVLYQDTRQITLTAQGASVADYDVWLPLFHESMMTFRVHAAPAYKQKQAPPST